MRQLQILASLMLLSPFFLTVAESNVPTLSTLNGKFAESLTRRASSDAPKGYAPASIPCPSRRPFIRDSSSSVLSPEEKEWLLLRRHETVKHIKDFLKRAAIPNFNSDEYLYDADGSSPALPNIGIAISGGGYRSMLTSAGVFKAFDSRSEGSTDKGNLGGLLQSATYFTGLSGGAWLVGSIYANNFTTVQDALNTNIWDFEKSILQGPKNMKPPFYYAAILQELDDKLRAGFNRSVTDIWGRMLSFQMINARNGGPGYTFSSIAKDPQFSAGKIPLPIVVSSSRAPDSENTTIESLLFEFNPWELGSTDPGLNGFVPLRYTGSKFDKGRLAPGAHCIAGFDNIGFIMGTSSSMFDQVLINLKKQPFTFTSEEVPKIFVKFVEGRFLTALGDQSDDVANWAPNPFKNWNAGQNYAADSESLTLVDGGEDDQNIAYHPHTIHERKVDVVFSVDASADTNSWPRGAAPYATYRRTLSSKSAGTSFPIVPSPNTFINLGLNTRPTFFGCNASASDGPVPPLIVYLPNYPYVFSSNLSTFNISFENDVRDAIVANGWALATQMNSTIDSDWPTCVGCAILSRSFDRTNTAVPAACERCFVNYCWDGTVDDREPTQPYEPQIWSKNPIEIAAKGKSKGKGKFLNILSGVGV